MAKAPTNQEQSDKEKQAELQAKKKAEQEELEKQKQQAELEKLRKEQEEKEKAEAEKKRLEAQAEQARLVAALAAEQKALEEELARNKKTTITMINPYQNEEPQEAEVHPDMVKHWEQKGWTVK